VGVQNGKANEGGFSSKKRCGQSYERIKRELTCISSVAIQWRP
jgi:hypothetical protein